MDLADSHNIYSWGTDRIGNLTFNLLTTIILYVLQLDLVCICLNLDSGAVGWGLVRGSTEE